MIPVVAENVLRWPAYLEVVGFLGAALVDLLGGVIDFKIVDDFGMVLGTGLTLVLVNMKGLGGGGGRGAEKTDGFKQVFPSNVNTYNCFCGIRNFFAHARFQILHVLFWTGVENLWLGYLNDYISYEFC